MVEPQASNPAHVNEISGLSVTDFLIDPNFVCMFGRSAAQSDQIEYAQLPSRISTGSIGTDDRPVLPPSDRLSIILTDALDKFTWGKKQACIFLDPSAPANHTEGFAQTWMMYATILSLALRQNDLNRSPESIWQRALELSQKFSDPKMANEYADKGLLTWGGRRLFLIAMNSLYDASPLPHPRYCPHTMYVLTRESDIINVIEHAPKVAEDVAIKTMERSKFVYAGSLPYINPDSIDFAHPGYLQALGFLMQMERVHSQLHGKDLMAATQLALIAHRRVAASGQKMTEDFILKSLRDVQFI